jgi:SulP family sulfate permease
VIEGELRSWTLRDGRRVELNRHGRGDLIGEVGLVQGARSANVDCETSARLLRLAPAGLARLERRYPRIAARLYRNLGATLAERLVKATARLTAPAPVG